MIAQRARVGFAALADLAAVVVFVALGRLSHRETGSWWGSTLRILLPFVIGLVIAWGAAQAWKRPMRLTTGVLVWVFTTAVGLVLRRWVFDRGIAATFVVVTSLVLGLAIVGWRVLWQRRRA